MERQQESHKITTTATATKSRDEQKLSQPPFTNNFCFFRLFGVFNGNETHKTWPTSRPTIKIQTHTHTHTLKHGLNVGQAPKADASPHPQMEQATSNGSN